MTYFALRFLFALLLGAILAVPAFAQTDTWCAPPPSQAGANATSTGLLATYKCVSAAYTLQSTQQDVNNIVQSLERAGVAHLLNGNFDLTVTQRLLILNDYGFWQTKSGAADGSTIKALQIVVSLAPKRAAAWLNLGDAYLEAHNNQIPNVSAQQTAAYRHYLKLSQTPLQRVRDYMALVDGNTPAGVGNWTTSDAINNMVSAPQAAAIVLGMDNSSIAQVALALDLALLLPNPDIRRDEINRLLASSGPYSSPSFGEQSGFNGTTASLLPYISANLQFPLSCQLVQKFPILATAADAQYGSSEDAFDAYIKCSDSRFTLPASVQSLLSDLAGPSGFDVMCGTIVHGYIHHAFFVSDVITYLPQALLPPYTYLNGPQSGNFPSLGQQEADTLNRANLSPGATPLANWGETDIDSYRKSRKIAVDFHKAQTDLTTYYRTAFGFSQADATLAAFHGVWLLLNAYTWAIPGKTSPLAEALLGHEPMPQVQAALKAQAPAPASTLFLAVEYPEALRLLLTQKPDVTVTTPIGKTVLMEAAKYNQLESVKLLLAAGANVNVVSLAPENISNNYSSSPAVGDCTDGGYIIKHGQRTALMYAAANADLPVIQALLTAGADKTAKDSKGATALDYLEGKGPAAKNPVLSATNFSKAQALLAP